MKKVISILLIVCLALMVPMMALAEGGITITDKNYTWNKQKVTKPVFSGSTVTKAMNEIIDESFIEVQRVAQRTGGTGIVIDYTVWYQDENILSMGVFNRLTGDGMANDVILPYYIVFDLNTGKALHCEDVFTGEWEKHILARINAIIADPSKYSGEWDSDYCETVTELPAYESFNIFERDGTLYMNFIYAAGAIQPNTGLDSRIAFYFPISSLADFIADSSPVKALIPKVESTDEVTVTETPAAEIIVRFGIIGGVMGGIR